MTGNRLNQFVLVAEAGVDRELFDDPENTLSFAAPGQLLALAAKRGGCPHIGLLLGERRGLHVLGPVGELVRRATDVGSALNSRILYRQLHDCGAVPALWNTGQRSMLVYSGYQAELPGVEYIYDGAVPIACHLLRDLAGLNWKPTEIRLSRPRPMDCAPYRRLFNAPLLLTPSRAA